MAGCWRQGNANTMLCCSNFPLDWCIRQIHLFRLHDVLEGSYCSVSWVPLDGKILELGLGACCTHCDPKFQVDA